MSIWVLLQVVFNLAMLMGVALCLVRSFREPKDDPRLNHGLRLLQSKISILEDLSDHTENQVKQLMALLDKKLIDVRGAIHQVNGLMGEVGRSIADSRKMAEEFKQELVPDKIVEKKIENKYIQAAKMAHQGMAVDEIVKQLGLPKGEVQLIAKINRDKCVYAEDENVENQIFSQSLQLPEFSQASADQVDLEFREAVKTHQENQEKSGFQALRLG